jgi:D-beta-D-heptose 7-phosphate kinase/D-beta-D-heptose 1-phosphate adenosyltransferase
VQQMIFADWRDFLAERDRLRQSRKRLVITNGCFDLLHPGHLHLLEKASSFGDALLVAINTDRSVCEMKGENRPIIPQQERAEVLDALESVDYVACFDEPTPRELIAALRPDVLVKGADWSTHQIVGRGEVEATGGNVVRIDLEPGFSTTAIIETIINSQERA